MRRLIMFPCAGEELAGTLDEAAGRIGLLIASGGNEIRIGAHRGMCQLAATIAAAGHPVFRFDRRGIGDSTGVNRGFSESGPDIVAAVQAFRAHAPRVERIIGFGNCDAATALMLFHRAASLAGLILANPWLDCNPDGLPPRSAIRARYAERLRDPRQWLRLARGNVEIPSLVTGLRKVLQPRNEEVSKLADEVARALNLSDIPATLLLAQRDNTAMAFNEAWAQPRFDRARARIVVRTCDSASHSFAPAADKEWLAAQILDLLGD